MTNDKAADLFKQLAKKAGMTDEAVTLALSQPEWKEIENRDNRHSEYSSALDRLKNLEPQAEENTKWKDWWNNKGGKTLYEQQAIAAQRLTRYQERFGELDADSNDKDVRRAAEGTGLTMVQVQALIDSKLNEQGVRFSAMSNELLAVIADAGTRGITLSGDDVVAMNKLMAEKGVTYAGAYETHMGPRVREMEQQKTEKLIKQQVDERVKDELSRRGVNGLPVQSDVPNFFDRPKDGMADKPKSDQELLTMWAEAGELTRK